MSSANVDLVRSIFASWEHGDSGPSVESAPPDIEFVITDGPSPGRWAGPAVTTGYREVLTAWEDFCFHAEEYRELDSERVLVLVRFSGRGKTSGLEVGHMRAEGATLFSVRGGKVNRIDHYWNRERGLADLGLDPEADAAD